MFGDDTWARLFPDTFLRQDPVSSFFVSDYTQVDTNVSRHLAGELSRQDWDVMILHYLGLDHIGHTHGPRSHLVPDKLAEMSEVIRTLWSGLKSRRHDTTGLAPMIVVLGDHGMADGGGHGGSTDQETRVPCVFISDNVSSLMSSSSGDILQVDIAPSLAYLTGVPIPRHSIGMFTSHGQHDTMQYNAQHLADLVSQAGIQCDGQEMLEQALATLDEVLATKMYRAAALELQKCLVGKTSNYDMYQINLALVMMALVLLVNLSSPTKGISSVTFLAVFLISSSLHTALCSQLSSDLCSVSLGSCVKLIFSAAVIVTSVSSLIHSKLGLTVTMISSDMLPVIINIVSTLSLASSSFVEEEHQTHYFFFITILLVSAYKDPSNLKHSILTMFLHRLLRNFNQTGDKWKHLPDLKDWFETPEHATITTGCFLTALACLAIFNTESKSVSSKIASLTFHCGLICQKLQPSVTADQICLALVALNMIAVNRNELLLRSFLFLALTLHSEVDVILIAILLLQLQTLKKFISQVSPTAQPFVTLLMMKVAYFYFGNSNSLASIDVGAGYTGMISYNPGIITFLMAVHTYSGPIIVLTFYQSTIRNLQWFTKAIFVSMLLEIFVFCTISTILRYHLFVWTVFSPKLLYLGMNLIVNSCLCTLIS